VSFAKLSLKGRALKLLAQREHSRLELQSKLAAHVEEGDDLNAVLDELPKDGRGDFKGV
jgi:regulatory protein